MMIQSHKIILQNMRSNIIKDLDVYNGVIPPLTTEYVLKSEDVINIKKGKSKQERAQILLDILPDRGPSAFEIFHQSLKQQYWWLSDEMDQMLELYSSGDTINDNSFNYSNLQPISPLTVTRVKLVDQLKKALIFLKPNEYVVLHGMKGYGKSCLTASTIKDTNFDIKHFNNEIYWIKFGYERIINEEIVIQLNNLYHQINHLNSLDAVNTETLEKTLYQTIKHYFRQSNHRNALLILDDVCHKEVVDKFDFDCKTLVITSDIGVLEKRNRIIVEMRHGFTEEETLGLFAKVLDINVDRLPFEAKLIHKECKGMPLLIAMFAAQFENFKFDMSHDKGRWQYYLNCLKTKNAKNKVMREFMKIQETTFDMCIDQLEKKMRNRYENLVIFSEDVNIMPKTLEILWSEQPYFVDEIMLDFCHKSLAAKKWNDDLRSYIYGVHDLLLCHLRKKLSPIQLRDKHKLFIKKCRYYCKDDFSKLPNDNYCFSYIGHHLEQAELFEDFHKIYFNFDFLQAKIKYAGLSDLFIDLKKYRKYITKNGDAMLESNLIDIERFLENHTDTLAKHRLLKCLNLVQIALENSNEGFVKNQAKKLAISRPFLLYFFHKKNNMSNPYLDFCEEVTIEVSTVAFTDDPSHILVGSRDGKIILWDLENRQSKVFYGHKNNEIKKIVLSLLADYFLALSNDGTLKLFYLANIEYTKQGLKVPQQNPRSKQTNWRGLFEQRRDDSLKTFEIDDEYITDMIFTQDTKYIVACTNAGTVRLWDFNGSTKWEDTYKNNSFGGVSFTYGDNLLHVINETTSEIRVYKKDSQNYYKYVSQYNLQLNKTKVIYFSKHPEENNCLIVITNKKVLYLKWFSNNNEHVHSYEKYTKTEEKDENIYYVAATLTYDARYLIIGNSNGVISVMKAFNPDDLITCFKGKVTSLDSYWMKNEDFHLICGSGQRWIHRWKIRGDEKPKSVKKFLFDAKITSLDDNDVVVLKKSPNVLMVYYEKNKTIKIDSQHGRIIDLKLDESGEKLIYNTENDFVIVYDWKKNETVQVSKLSPNDRFIKVLQIKCEYLVLYTEENNFLKVSKNKISKKVEGSNCEIFFFKLFEDYIVSVSKNGMIKCWLIEDVVWHKISEFKCDNDMTVINSCLSINNHYLAFLTDNKEVVIYKLAKLMRINEKLNVEWWMKKNYEQNLRICEFSKDEKYIAIALDNGEISVIELETFNELGKLTLHSSNICQLIWSPITISVPILMTVSCDELAWWNINFLKNMEKSQNRRSRMGLFSRSISSPTIGSVENYETTTTTTSISLPMSCELTDIQKSEKTAVTSSSKNLNVDHYWSLKLPADSDSLRPAFLGCVQLPTSCTGKINMCVSSDFSRFLTVDIHGTVSNYVLFNDTID